MNQSAARFDPKQIFDAEWRNRAWKGWLRSRWVGRDEVSPPPPEGGVRPATMAPPPLAPQSSGQTVAREIEFRRSELRQRFDGIVDGLGRLEDSLESLAKRFALQSIHGRRHEQRVLERVDGILELLERQTLALEATQVATERLEQRMDRLERRWRGEEGGGEAASPRDVVAYRSAPPRGPYEDYAELEEALSFDSRTGSRSAPPIFSDFHDASVGSGPSIHGNLAEMSLGTVLAMLELERRTGFLQVTAEDGNSIRAALRAGSIVRAWRREVEVEPVEAFREALRFKNGHFGFRQSAVEDPTGPARSVGSVLLEATSRNDEAARVG